MTDFYEELELDRSLSAEELNRELNQMESVWRRREITNPEKATKKIALIIDARKVFATEQTKAAYDRELKNSRQRPAEDDPDAVRAQNREKWFADAQKYYKNGEFDLAKAAIERALALQTPEMEDPDILYEASRIYLMANEPQRAIDYANQTILIAPEETMPYVTKALAYNMMYADAIRLKDIQNARNYNRLQEETFYRIHNMIRPGGIDDHAEAVSAAWIANDRYFRKNEKTDEVIALAERAAELGDPMQLANPVLEDARARAEEARKKQEEEEAERKNKIYADAVQKMGEKVISATKAAIELFETIPGWKDADEKTEECRRQLVKLEKRSRRRKKTLMIVLPLAALIGAAAFLFQYFDFHKAGPDITWTLKDGVLSLKGTGQMYDYSGVLDAPWDENNDYDLITRIEIGEGITYIGDFAFRFCRNVKDIELPSTLEAVGDNVFESTGLTEFDFPEGIRYIGGCVFESAEVARVSIPASAEYIEESAFRGAPQLKGVSVDPDNPYYSDIDGIFFDKSQNTLICYSRGEGAENYTIPDHVKTISGDMFSTQSFLDSITLGASVDLSQNWKDPNKAVSLEYGGERHEEKNLFQYIADKITGGDSSYSSAAVEDLYAEEDATELTPGYRLAWSDLDWLYVSEENPYYRSENGVLYSKDMTVLYWYPPHYPDSTYYTVPEGVTEIAPYAFYGWNNNLIEQVTLPSTLRVIGTSAFNMCNHITEIVIPEGVTAIEHYAFGSCRNLNYVWLPSSIQKVSVDAFRDNENLNEVYYNGTMDMWSAVKADEEQIGLYDVKVICDDGVIERRY